jgi:hypothetical protein
MYTEYHSLDTRYPEVPPDLLQPLQANAERDSILNLATTAPILTLPNSFKSSSLNKPGMTAVSGQMHLY